MSGRKLLWHDAADPTGAIMLPERVCRLMQHQGCRCMQIAGSNKGQPGQSRLRTLSALANEDGPHCPTASKLLPRHISQALHRLPSAAPEPWPRYTAALTVTVVHAGAMPASRVQLATRSIPTFRHAAIHNDSWQGSSACRCDFSVQKGLPNHLIQRHAACMHRQEWVGLT